MRRFYAPTEHFRGEHVTLAAEETRHLRDVLRLKAGDEAHVFDGAGHEFLCVIKEVRRSETTLDVIREVEPAAPESGLDLTLAVSAYKSDKLDLVVQKAVELGVARLSPVVTSRGEVKLRHTAKRTERWRKIALEATKQCERALVMQIDEPVSLEDLIAGVDEDAGLRLMFSEKGGGGIPTTTDHQKITALVGPKGGWEDSEIDLAVGRGFIAVKLGRRIMRAETAAITFAALLQHSFGDLR
jgi:16S rRNA (uracil1498-N3)-methyltransferase